MGIVEGGRKGERGGGEERGRGCRGMGEGFFLQRGIQTMGMGIEALLLLLPLSWVGNRVLLS